MLQALNAEAPPGVRKSYILWALAEQATKLGCFKVRIRQHTSAYLSIRMLTGDKARLFSLANKDPRMLTYAGVC